MNKKKILLISHSSSETGGAEDDFVSLLKFLSSKKEDYIIECMFPKGKREDEYKKYCSRWSYISWGFFPVIYSGIFQYFKYCIKFWFQFYQIIRFVYNRKYDLCIVNVVVLVWPVLIIKLFGIPTIVMMKETIEPEFFRRSIYLLLSNVADYFIPNSRIIEKDFVRTTKNINIQTVYSCLENDYLNSHISPKIISERKIQGSILAALTATGKTKLLCVGNIKKIKNQEVILKALSSLKKQNVLNFDLFLVGDTKEQNEYYQSLSNYCSENSLENNVHFIEILDRYELSKIFSMIDILIISSISEGIPLVLVYALYYKKLVISSNVGGISDVIKSGYNGLLFDGSENRLADLLIEISEGKLNLNDMVLNGHKTFLTKFNWLENMLLIESVIQNVLSSKQIILR